MTIHEQCWAGQAGTDSRRMFKGGDTRGLDWQRKHSTTASPKVFFCSLVWAFFFFSLSLSLSTLCDLPVDVLWCDIIHFIYDISIYGCVRCVSVYCISMWFYVSIHFKHSMSSDLHVPGSTRQEEPGRWTPTASTSEWFPCLWGKNSLANDVICDNCSTKYPSPWLIP